MTLEVLFNNASFVVGSMWKLRKHTDGYKNEYCDELVTQARVGRAFQLLDAININFKNSKIIHRVKVRLLEDDYVCWFKFSELIQNASRLDSWDAEFFSEKEVFNKIPEILDWAKAAKEIPNKYLWGGTIGPDFDCSGLVQSSFASVGVWIPRDAYQQENFCQNVALKIENLSEKLIPGDLLFFGSAEKCSHVGLHIENGFYIHSSGVSDGHNGIEIDELFPQELGNIASFYRSKFRSAGRVISSYQSENSEKY